VIQFRTKFAADSLLERYQEIRVDVRASQLYRSL
jgi:hypothetical protein